MSRTQAHTEGVYTIGRIGLSLLVMEGGLGIDVDRFKKTWMLTTNLALTGTLLPCLLGWGLLSIFGYGTLEGFAAGTVSLQGIRTPSGQSPCCASFSF